MDTEMAGAVGARRARPRFRRWLSALWLTLGLSCFAQKPSGESAPSAPAAAPTTAPAAEAPPVLAPRPAEQFEESLDEKKSQRPASAEGVSRRAAGAAPAPPPSPAPAPAKPAAKRAPAAQGAADGERAIGGNHDDAARDAPALRQRLDRAFRAGSPDCPSARDRKKAVCDLATQICKLTDRDPNVASVAEYCSEAKHRCSEAERRTVERCPD